LHWRDDIAAKRNRRSTRRHPNRDPGTPNMALPMLKIQKASLPDRNQIY
jgi:hypothetical protein